MRIKDIIKQLELFRQAPCFTEQDKVVIDEACRKLRTKSIIETVDMEIVKSIIELLAGIVGVATYLQHMLS